MVQLRNILKRFIAVLLFTGFASLVWFAWPLVTFLYHERTLAEAVRKYSETSGLLMTSDDDIRGYLVKLAHYHRLELGEGDVDVDYQDAPETFGVPARIGYTLVTRVDFRGWRVVPVVAQRSFSINVK